MNPKLFAVSQEVIMNVYENWGSFKEILIAQDESNWKYLNEFKSFFALFENSNFGRYIAFDFKIIPIALKMDRTK